MSQIPTGILADSIVGWWAWDAASFDGNGVSKLTNLAPAGKDVLGSWDLISYFGAGATPPQKATGLRGKGIVFAQSGMAAVSCLKIADTDSAAVWVVNKPNLDAWVEGQDGFDVMTPEIDGGLPYNTLCSVAIGNPGTADQLGLWIAETATYSVGLFPQTSSIQLLEMWTDPEVGPLQFKNTAVPTSVVTAGPFPTIISKGMSPAIGARWSLGQYWSGTFYEAVVAKSPPTDDQVVAMRAYFRGRYPEANI